MRQLNPRALEYLNALSRFGTLRKAAARLSVDPATVSPAAQPAGAVHWPAGVGSSQQQQSDHRRRP